MFLEESEQLGVIFHRVIGLGGDGFFTNVANRRADAGIAGEFDVAIMIADEPTGGEVDVVFRLGGEDHARCRFAHGGVFFFKMRRIIDGIEGCVRAKFLLHPFVNGGELFMGDETSAHALLIGHEDEQEALFFQPAQHFMNARLELKIPPAQHVAALAR